MTTTETQPPEISDADGGGPISTSPAPVTTPPPLSPVAFLRWCWRQLTSMRTALILLFLLALGAIPGSVIPQEQVDSVLTSQWQTQHPTLTPIYQKLGLFHVYGSVWFSAIYLLLLVSLVGCIVPRSRVYWRALRAQPPRAPSNLSRLPEHTSFETDAAPDDVLARARRELRGFRLRRTEEDADAVSAERGYLREAGNLLFHLSVLVVLLGVAAGTLFGYKGGVIVVTGDSFSNTATQYDDMAPGALFNPDHLSWFRFTLDSFKVDFIREGRNAGTAHEFSGRISYQAGPHDKVRTRRISVNHPLKLDGTSIYLISHGYAPHITVRDGQGHVAWTGYVTFIPEDTTFRSFGVVKVPDAVAQDGKPEQLGFEGELYPTYATHDKMPFSAFPDATNPVVSLQVYRGDLGLDGGTPQSVFTLDKKHLTALKTTAGKPLRATMALGQTVTLPDGMGTITFDSINRYVKLQISRSPGDWVALLGMILALLGLLGSLFLRPRRVWVRARRQGGRTLVEIAGLDRRTGGDLAGEVSALAARLGSDAPDAADESDPPDTGKESSL